MNSPSTRYVKLFSLFLFVILIFSFLLLLKFPANISSFFQLSTSNLFLIFIQLLPIAILIPIFFTLHNIDDDLGNYKTFVDVIEKVLYTISLILVIYFLFYFILNNYVIESTFTANEKKNDISYEEKLKKNLFDLYNISEKAIKEKRYQDSYDTLIKILMLKPTHFFAKENLPKVKEKIIENNITKEEEKQIFSLEIKADSYFNKKEYTQAKMLYDKLYQLYPVQKYKDNIKKCNIGIKNKEADLGPIKDDDRYYHYQLNLFLDQYRSQQIYKAYQSILDLYLKYPNYQDVQDFFQNITRDIEQNEFFLPDFFIKSNYMENYNDFKFKDRKYIYTAEKMYVTEKAIYLKDITVRYLNDLDTNTKYFKYAKLKDNKLFLKSELYEISTLRKFNLRSEEKFIRFLHPDNYWYLFFLSPIQIYHVKKLANDIGIKQFIYEFLFLAKILLPLAILIIIFFYFINAWYLRKHIYSIHVLLFILIINIITTASFLILIYLSIMIGMKLNNLIFSYIFSGLMLLFTFLTAVFKLIRINIQNK